MPARHVKRAPAGPVKRGGGGGPLGFILIGLICVGVGMGIGHLLFSKKGSVEDEVTKSADADETKSDDYKRERQKGYDKGKADGYKKGYGKGEKTGLDEGKEKGIKIGKKDGFDNGYKKAKADYYKPRYEEGKKKGLEEGLSQGKKFTDPFIIDAGDNVHISIVNPSKDKWEKVSISIIVADKAYLLHCKSPILPDTMKILKYKDFKLGNTPLTKIPEKDAACEIKYSIKDDESGAMNSKRFDIKIIRGDAKPAPKPEKPE